LKQLQDLQTSLSISQMHPSAPPTVYVTATMNQFQQQVERLQQANARSERSFMLNHSTDSSRGDAYSEARFANSTLLSKSQPKILSDHARGYRSSSTNQTSLMAIDEMSHWNVSAILAESRNPTSQRVPKNSPPCTDDTKPSSTAHGTTENPFQDNDIVSNADLSQSGKFPQKLYNLLNTLRERGRCDIAAFLPHGRAFHIHKPSEFISDVMPQYFRMSRFASFQKQLNLYNFQKINHGPDKGAYQVSIYPIPLFLPPLSHNRILYS
jgi:HSF-type DNA-binding